jgi:hypothetical protein
VRADDDGHQIGPHVHPLRTSPGIRPDGAVGSLGPHAPPRLRDPQLRAHLGHERRLGDVGVARAEGRIRVVFEPELDGPGGALAREDRREAQAEVDPRGDAAAGDAVPVDDHAAAHGRAPKRGSMCVKAQ